MGMHASIDLSLGYRGACKLSEILGLSLPVPDGNEVHLDWDVCAKILNSSPKSIPAEYQMVYWRLIFAIQTAQADALCSNHEEYMLIGGSIENREEWEQAEVMFWTKYFDLTFI